MIIFWIALGSICCLTLAVVAYAEDFLRMRDNRIEQLNEKLREGRKP